MKVRPHPKFTGHRLAITLGIACVAFALTACSPEQSSDRSAATQGNDPEAPATTAPSADASTNGPPDAASTPGTETNAPAQPLTNGTAAPSSPVEGAPVPPTAPPPGGPPSVADQDDDSEDGIQVSFQGANIDMIVQWLAKTTGKSVVKHPRVQCQLTIVSSSKVSKRDALNLIYRALSLEGFATIESSNAILIVPEGQEPKMSPELMAPAADTIPEGRQRLMKVFQVQHLTASGITERLKGVLSEQGTLEADDRGNRIIATDYTENIRLLAELIPQLDLASPSDSDIRIYALKFAEAEQLASLLTLVLNERPAPPSSPSSPSSSVRSSRPTVMMPGMPQPSSPPSSGSPPSTATGDEQVRFWPDPTSNRLIVSAPRSRIPEIEELIRVLDAQKPADVAIRVLPLKHVNAVDLIADIAPLYQRMSGRSLKDMIEVSANDLSNSLIVLSSEVNFKAIEELVQTLDTPDAQDKIVRTFPLRNADAEDVAEQLRELNDGQAPTARYIYYYSFPSSAAGRSRKMSVVADRRRNVVIIQAPPAQMEGIAEMIRALDEPVTDNTLAPRIIPLKFVSAVDIEDVLNELFLKREQQRDYWDYIYSFNTGSGRDDTEAGRLYGKVRITSEPYSNSIIITANSPENLAAVEAVIKQLDVPSQAGESTIRFGLKFAESIPVANNLNILFARGGSPPLRQTAQQQQPQQDPRLQQQNASSGQSGFQLERKRDDDTYFPWLGGQPENFRSTDGTTVRPASDLIGRVRIVPDSRSNSLLITANVHFLPQILKLVNELDVPTAQVLIEAKIIEVSSDFRDRLGVRWSPDGSRVFDADDFDNSIIPTGSVEYLRLFTGSADPAVLHSGILDASVNLDLLIQFLRKNTDATVVGEPQINVSDNELGKLFVGAQVPFISSSLNTQEGGRNDSFQYKDVGVILEVTPHINNSEEVSLKIHAESSNIRSGETLFGGAILDTRNFHTDLLIKSGQTAVLGGIIQREESEIVRKVPILGNIPVLGWLFKKQDTVTRNVELMVFLRPRITRTPEEAAQLMQEVRGKTPRLNERDTTE